MSKRSALAVSSLLALLPALAMAAEEHGGGGGGMPQLRFNEPIVVAQVVWLLIIFGLLYFIMSSVALPRVAAVLEERRRRIEGDLGVAQAAKLQADAALEEHRAATARARAEAQTAINAAVTQAQGEAATRAEAQNAKLNVQIEAAERQIATARDSAMGALRQVSAETAEALVSRLLGGADRGAINRAVDRELSARGHA